MVKDPCIAWFYRSAKGSRFKVWRLTLNVIFADGFVRQLMRATSSKGVVSALSRWEKEEALVQLLGGGKNMCCFFGY